MEVRLASLYSLAISSGLRQRMKSPSMASRSGCRQMQQRREWRGKSGGVLGGVEEGEEVEDIEEVRETEEVTEDVGEIDANGEGSDEIADGAGIGGAAVVWSVA